MRRSKKLFCGFALVTIFMACSNTARISESETPRTPASAQLPDFKHWEKLTQFAKNLDLASPNISLSPSTGGTSVYGVVSLNGKVTGAIIPENSATVLSGEILAFNLARAFHVETIYQPAFYHFLTGRNLTVFKSLVDNMPAKFKLKRENKTNIQDRIRRNPQGIPAIFKEFGAKPVDYDALVSVSNNSLNKVHILRGSKTPLASFLLCEGPMPSINTTISINGGTNAELFAAIQLSTIFLIDALTQQWDRFSGGNLQTITTKDGIVKFVAYDNGGTWGGLRWTEKSLKIVTRFDSQVTNEIIQMNKFFKNGTPYQGLRTDSEFAEAFGIAKFPQALANLKKSLPIVVSHLQAHQKCHFPL